ncbi:CHY zinc finger protein [Paenibacillus apiarius]|uniref:CHY zinc finger protein n=1 Tax=Paenibacillus apiarius TaxID=46240 RepID=UPI00198029DF|nr:CHY zinc finger protein [Paenibacillus apiarius]MBN3527386.1 hypothetical protein [Paenibacillus apiarius]
MIHVAGAIDEQSRCRHYHEEVDIVAIKFKCCDTYYGCYFCHEEAAGHTPEVWLKEEWDTKAILCGNCNAELTINEYLTSHYRCPLCHVPFNPGCVNHNHLYFE